VQALGQGVRRGVQKGRLGVAVDRRVSFRFESHTGVLQLSPCVLSLSGSTRPRRPVRVWNALRLVTVRYPARSEMDERLESRGGKSLRPELLECLVLQHEFPGITQRAAWQRSTARRWRVRHVVPGSCGGVAEVPLCRRVKNLSKRLHVS